jgi:hypothetical protein
MDGGNNMSLLGGFTSKISPSQTSGNSLGFSIDYSQTGRFISLTTSAINKPYLSTEPEDLVGTPLIGEVEFDTLNLQSSQISSNFGSGRSMGFSFRPFFAGNDYQFNIAKLRYLYIPSCVIFNQRTGQMVFIRSQNLPIVSSTVGGVTSSYVPMSMIVQGVVPFYFDLNDIVELACINPSSANIGKLNLTFFNFDVPPWYQTGIDALILAD